MIESIGIWIRKNKPFSWILISFIGVPVFIQMHWWPIYPVVVFLTPGNHGNWLQFWGSYLGVIPSGLIAALVAGYQIKEANKQNDKTRRQDLITMRNTKILDYLYEIKSALSKSEVILNTDKPFCSDQDLYNYLQELDHAMFESDNWKVLKDNHNRLYFLRVIVFDKSADEEFYKAMDEYTESIKSINGFLIGWNDTHENNEYQQDCKSVDFVNDFNKTRPLAVSQIAVLFVIVDKKINELSA